MIGLLIGIAALGGGFWGARRFVRRRLRFVDAVHRPAAPLLDGDAAAAVALPVAALPLVTVATADAFGVGVAGGAASARRPRGRRAASRPPARHPPPTAPPPARSPPPAARRGCCAPVRASRSMRCGRRAARASRDRRFSLPPGGPRAAPPAALPRSP